MNFLLNQQLSETALSIITTLLSGAIAGIIINRAITIFFAGIKNKSRLSSYTSRLNTLESLFENFSYLVIFLMVVLMILKDLGVDTVPILTGAGILGLAISFGSQTLVKDLISGFFIIVENQYNIGDKVTIASQEGVVRAIHLRTTVLETDKTRIFIPNSEIKNVIVFRKSRTT